MGPDKLIQSQNKKSIFSDRLVVMMVVILLMYVVLILKFYKLQIVDHDEYEKDLRMSVERTVEVPAVRGIIYDRYGTPLANNKPIYVLKVDPQVTKIDDTTVFDKNMLNEVLLSVANLLESNGDTYIDNMPISKSVPFVYTGDESEVHSFITNYVPYDDQEHKFELYELSAEGLMDYLRNDIFALDESISDVDARKIIAMRLEMYQTAYQKYKQITIAENISEETLAAIEENKEKYPSIFAEVESQRNYEYPKEFGNILGYTRKITASRYEELASKGYDKDDVIGYGGIESTMETELRGQKGEKIIEVDNVGREVSTLKETDNKAGNDVYLTIDADLQVQAYNALEKQLSAAIVQRLKGGVRGLISLTGREVLVSMIECNQLDMKEMSSAPESTAQRQLYNKVYADYETTLNAMKEEAEHLPEEEKEAKEKEISQLTFKKHFSNMMNAENSTITNQEMLLALGEQRSLQLDDSMMERIRSGTAPSVESILIAEYESGRLKPDQAAIAPFSGSAVVVDVDTGEVLSLVGYPSFDSNLMTQQFNSYYPLFNDGIDGRDLLWNRATRTLKAPGSTFKMITGIAALEEGVIEPSTVINDTGYYKNAGEPYPECWIYTNNGYGHGPVDIERGLEVSCNYYFFDLAYRLGLKYGMPYGGIDALTKYVKMFGLDQVTGVELDEATPNISNPSNIVTTNTTNALRNLRNMSDNGKELLKENVMEALVNGFYPYGSSKSTDVEGRIDYLIQYDIKRSLDTELANVLGSEIGALYERMLKDIQEDLEGGVTPYVDEVVKTVLANTSDISLKIKTKNALLDVLAGTLKDSTHRAILKVVKKMPESMVNDAFKDAYTSAYNRAEGESAEVANVLKSKINSIEAGTFDAYDLLVNKVEERIISTYLDKYFANINMEWTTGITIRTAIGQGNNAFAPIQVARYIAGLANGKTVYDLRVVDGIYDNKNTGSHLEKESVVRNTLNFKESTLKSIYAGMHRVVSSPSGTGYKYFLDFPIEIAGKSGTAQEGNHEHAWFVGFAPYDDPQIAIVTSMYDASGLGSYNYQLANDVLSAYFGTNEEVEGTTLDNTFVE